MKMFPVLWQGSREYKYKLEALDCPREVPWGFIEQYREGCMRNHDQTPERLAERGGLGPEEMNAVVLGTASWEQRKLYWAMLPEESVPLLKNLLLAWTKSEGKTKG